MVTVTPDVQQRRRREELPRKGGFSPSSFALTTTTPSSSSVALRVAIAVVVAHPSFVTRLVVEELEGVVVVRVEVDGGNPLVPRQLFLSPSSQHIRRCRRLLGSQLSAG